MRKLKIPFIIAVLLALLMATGYVVMAKEDTTAENTDGLKVYNEHPDTIRQMDIGSGPKVCKSSDEDIAVLKSDGELILGEKTGKAEIDVYRLSGKKKHLKFVVRTANDQIIVPSQKEYSVTLKDEPFDLAACTTAEEGNKITYRSENEDIATVSPEGTVTVKKAGSTRIIIHADGSESYYEAELAIPVAVEKDMPELKTEQDAYTVTTKGGNTITLKASSESDGKITYTSKDPSIAEVNENGVIIPHAAGDVTILIEQEETDKYSLANREVFITVTEPKSSDYAKAAVEWARKIGNDDSFAYGAGDTAHRTGCYFCGTNWGPNKYKKAKGYEKTYCCNTFCFSAYAHGAGIPAMLSDCKGGHNGAWGNEWQKFGFKNIGKPDYSELLPGDIMTDPGHMWMITDPENDLMIDASGGGWGSSSISEHKGAAKRYGETKFVLRYEGK